ncbi:MAG: hypothetical protein H0X39_00280 [Actinobacteria bacterium]|nr:hypothetical protein [Gemmatimonadaceae bacterium]MBA3841057.1 hypothetical protein [Actinomycetota bacterium]
MNLRNVLIAILILVLLSHFVGVSFAYGGPLSLLVFVVLICALVGAL